MITIEFFDRNGRFVCKHLIEFDDDCYYELGEVDDYVDRIFQLFESAGRADIFYETSFYTIWRYE